MSAQVPVIIDEVKEMSSGYDNSPKVLLAPQADLHLKSEDAPFYQYVKQNTTNNSGQLTLGASTNQSTWMLDGSTVWNTGRGYITANLLLAASTNATVVQADTIPIDSVLFSSVNGTEIAKLAYVQRYAKVSQAISIALEEYLSRGPAINGATAAAAFYSECKGCQPCNALVTAQGAATTPIAQYLYNATAGAVAYSQIALTVDAGIDRAYIAKQRVLVAGGAGAGLALNISYNIPLKAFLGTVLAIDQDILYGQNMILTINWSPLANFVSDVAVGTTLAGANIAFAGAATLSDIALWIPKEVNANLVAKLNKLYRGDPEDPQVAGGSKAGYDLYLPYTNCSTNSVAATGSWSVTQQLNAGMGLSLKRIITVPVCAPDTLGVANMGDNVNAHLYNQLQTKLNSSPLQQAVMRCGQFRDDWEQLYPLIKKSAAGLSFRDFQINPFWMDSFANGCQNSSEFIKNDVLDDGMRMGPNGMQYVTDFNVTQTGGMRVYQYVTFCRRLRIAGNTLTWVDGNVA